MDDIGKIYKGDALDFLRTLDDCSVDAVITDPPYCFSQMGDGWAATDERKTTKGQTVGNLSSGMAFSPNQGRQLAEWFTQYARHIHRVLKPGAFAAVFSAPRLAHGFCVALENAGFCIREVQSWCHDSGQFKAGNLSRYGIDSDMRVPMPRPMHESIVIAHKFGTRDGVVSLHKTYGTALIPARMLAGGLPESTLRGPKPNVDERKRAGNHPTPKPEWLMAELCHLWCPPGGLVVDPFAGSGSTGVGALLSGRRFAGSEHSDFADIAERRLRATLKGTVA